jgi:hypothetical protein
MTVKRLGAAVLLGSAALAATFFATPASAATCIGNCGTSGADGSVGLSPSGNSFYDWVSTNLGQNGAGQLPGFEGTNGSELISDTFFAAAGTEVKFFFNYVTSDGSGFADYAWSQLRTSGGDQVATLFTARTRPEGTIVPGTNLPGVEAVLTPASVPIISGSPDWSPLGGSTGSCYAAGCGYTGWIESSFKIANAGSYSLAFGVTNFLDSSFDTGLAFDGILVGGSVLGDGSSAGSPLLPADLGPNGEFKFEFTATPNQMVFVDPLVAVGYDYIVGGGSPLITKALFPTLAGDPDGYDIFALSDLNTALFTGVLGGTTVDFTTLSGLSGGIGGFALRGISPAAMLNPANPAAFVTGLEFASGGVVQLTQTPISIDIAGAVPEPATWAMMILGFGAIGTAVRRRPLSPALAA